MYNKIVNPVTGKKVSIYGKLGKTIIRNYMIQAGGDKLVNTPLIAVENMTDSVDKTAKREDNTSKREEALTTLQNLLHEGEELTINCDNWGCQAGVPSEPPTRLEKMEHHIAALGKLLSENEYWGNSELTIKHPKDSDGAVLRKSSRLPRERNRSVWKSCSPIYR